MGEMRIITSFALTEVKNLPANMRRAGDSKIMWDPENEDEVEAAEAQFDILVSKGFRAFKVDKKGDKTGGSLKKFDPKLSKLIMVPTVAGG